MTSKTHEMEQEKLKPMYKRNKCEILKKRMTQSRRFIQILDGPRHAGKSTLVSQVMADLSLPHLIFNADDVDKTDSKWISQCWSTARATMRVRKYEQCILIIDEIQKISNLSETLARPKRID